MATSRVRINLTGKPADPKKDDAPKQSRVRINLAGKPKKGS